MNNIYVSHNNIISSLGFTSETVVENIQNEISGLKHINDQTMLSDPFYTSLVPTEKLHLEFNKLNPNKDYTRLEQIMITSLSKIITSSKIDLTKRVGLIISTTKGNIDALDKNNPFDEKRAYLSELGKVISSFFNFKNDALIVSNACVSGILSVAIAKRYINEGVYDHVFIVSGDVITKFILSGFNSFQALSTEPCKPYDANRNGFSDLDLDQDGLLSDQNGYNVDADGDGCIMPEVDSDSICIGLPALVAETITVLRFCLGCTRC